MYGGRRFAEWDSVASDAGCKTVMVPDLTEPDAESQKRVVGVADTLCGVLKYID